MLETHVERDGCEATWATREQRGDGSYDLGLAIEDAADAWEVDYEVFDEQNNLVSDNLDLDQISANVWDGWHGTIVEAKGTHSLETVRYVYEQLALSGGRTKQIQDTLLRLGSEFKKYGTLLNPKTMLPWR